MLCSDMVDRIDDLLELPRVDPYILPFVPGARPSSPPKLSSITPKSPLRFARRPKCDDERCDNNGLFSASIGFRGANLVLAMLLALARPKNTNKPHERTPKIRIAPNTTPSRIATGVLSRNVGAKGGLLVQSGYKYRST